MTQPLKRGIINYYYFLYQRFDHLNSCRSVPIVLKAFSSTTETAKELSKEEKEKIVSTIEERERYVFLCYN